MIIPSMTSLPCGVGRKLLLHLAVLAAFLRPRGQDGAAAITAVAPPVATAGVLGQEAEFSCSVADKKATETLTWQLVWDGIPQFVHLRTSEKNVTSFTYDGFFDEEHATYTTRYIVNGSIQTSVLHLRNIQASDEGSVACMYQLYVGSSLITRPIEGFDPVRFTVWKLPSPTCSFAYLNPNTTLPDGAPPVDNATVVMSCEDTVGVPAPNLTWHEPDGDDEVVNGTVYTYRHELRAEDNGRWFHCRATSAATREPVFCSVRPMAVHPTAAVRPERLQLIQGAGNVHFYCAGRGLPEIVSYQWFIDGVPVYSVDRDIFPDIKVTVMKGMRESILTLKEILKLGVTTVSCEVMVPAGFTGRAQGVVIVYEDDRGSGPMSPSLGRKSHQVSSGGFQLAITPLALALILGVLVLLVIVAVVLSVWYRKQRRWLREQRYQDTETLSPAGVANGTPPRHTKRFWAYMVTTV